VSDEVLGVLDVQSDRPDAFDPESVATLGTLANQIASALQNMNLLEATRTDLQATAELYQASHRIAASQTRDEILRSLATALKQVPFISVLFRAHPNNLTPVSLIDPIRGAGAQTMPNIAINAQEFSANLPPSSIVTIRDRDPDDDALAPIINFSRQLGCQVITFYPIAPGDRLNALLILGAVDPDRFTPLALEPYESLVEITRTALEKVEALETIQQRLAELETLSAVGQSISTETDLDTLYEIVNNQIVQVMGDVLFLIALYQPEDQSIYIPYMDDGEEIISLGPFPLGEGLTSVIIRTRQPLKIVEDAVNRSQALGAIITETGFAKSFLGVPLLIGGEPIGAMAVQDLEHEYRFDDDDLRLMVTLASQVAIALHNARLLEETQVTAEQERKLYEITDKIRRSVDVRGVLRITAEEISKALGAQRAHIQISVGHDGAAELGDEEVTR
jgi:GAF domain-containing protein